jgi:methylphosphotriester-DNA--protein-cysteine methyltransferase
MENALGHRAASGQRCQPAQPAQPAQPHDRDALAPPLQRPHGRRIDRLVGQRRQVDAGVLRQVFQQVIGPNPVALVRRIGQAVDQVEDVHGVVVSGQWSVARGP